MPISGDLDMLDATPKSYFLNIQGRLLGLDVPKVMGIINLTPDSFFGRSRQKTEREALEKALQMEAEGADLLDLGAISTRPGAEEVSTEDELERLLPALKAIRKGLPKMPISIDTFRAEVARQALAEGADIINDVTGGEDRLMYEVVAQVRAPYILMHMRGTPQTMASLTTYDDLVPDILRFFKSRLEAARVAGVGDIVLDPGLGFAKTTEQNFELLAHLEAFKTLGCPLLIGLSRKGMIWKSLGIKPEEALNGTTALHMAALLHGAHILRVHDVKEAREAIVFYQALRSKGL